MKQREALLHDSGRRFAMRVRITLSKTTRKSVNLTLNDAMVKEAKAPGINMSREFEIHLASLVRQRKSAKWLAENLDTLDACNALIKRDGMFSDGLRSF